MAMVWLFNGWLCFFLISFLFFVARYWFFTKIAWLMPTFFSKLD